MPKKINYEEFAAQWNSANSIQELSDELKLDRSVVAWRASSARKLGYELKYFRSPPVNWDEFIRVWNAADSVKEAAEILGITENNAKKRASLARENGLDAKKFQTNKDVGKLSAYMAGVLDCHGNISVRKRVDRRNGREFFASRLAIVMPSEEVAELFEKKFGGKRETYGNSLYLCWYSREAIGEVLRKLAPHCVAKRDEIRDVLAFIDNPSDNTKPAT